MEFSEACLGYFTFRGTFRYLRFIVIGAVSFTFFCDAVFVDKITL